MGVKTRCKKNKNKTIEAVGQDSEDVVDVLIHGKKPRWKAKRRANFEISPINNFNDLTRDSLNQALKKRNMKLTEDLIYFTNENGRDVEVQKMEGEDLIKYKELKENARNGIYPPLELVFSEELGYYVKSKGMIKRNTLLTEYTGEVVDFSVVGESDSIMELMATKKSSIVIDPDKQGNIAKFISGINNQN